ncbi:hypothetical protein [Flavobacterium sp. ASW18X]|uniref:hypothetical protein n=1 Tax=Flavobacterium sp. ASW18X TaxID=2572595 RepID=UPI0010ADB396|nr:hypothetical protein [Flavobacterium sp. ASW18X]TKD60488.1 hypothetical protein FBT53_12845 [Flavobacterium sp. ASW18X]
MKNNLKFLPIALASAFIFSCEKDTVSEEFDNANGDVQEKKLESVAVSSVKDPQENSLITLTYNANGSLSTINTGEDASLFVYEGEELTNVTSGEDNLAVEELYQSPYDAFETGDVKLYDANGNPSLIEFFEEDFNYDNSEYEMMIYTAEITYDEAPNPFFYTLKAAGLVSILDNIDLNFSGNAQSTELLKARELFPLNNPSQIIYKNPEGEIEYTIKMDYEYDAANYATKATVTSSGSDNATEIYEVVFTYVE